MMSKSLKEYRELKESELKTKIKKNPLNKRIHKAKKNITRNSNFK